MSKICTNFTLCHHPIWISAWNAFVGIDLYAERWCIWKLDYYTLQLCVGELEGASKAAFIVPIYVRGKTGRFGIGIKREVAEFEWSGECFSKAKWIRTIVKVEQNPLIYGENHMHDGKTDPCGRLFFDSYCTNLCGTNNPNAALYRYDGYNVTPIFKNQKIPNGMAWNPKTNKFYYYETCTYTIQECDWDRQCGSIGENYVDNTIHRKIAFIRFHFYFIFSANCRCVIELEKSYDYCFSGMEIDHRGYLWICIYNRYLVYVICPK